MPCKARWTLETADVNDGFDGVFFILFFFLGVPTVNFEGGMLTGSFGMVTTFEEIGKHPAVAMAFPSLAAKYDCGGVVSHALKQRAHTHCELAADPPHQLRGRHLVVPDVQLPCNGTCKVHLPAPRRTPEEHDAWGLDPQVQEQFWAQEGVLNQLAQLPQEGGDPPKV